MNKFLAILYDTFLEIKSGKIIYLYGALTLVTFVGMALAPQFQIDGRDIIADGMVPQEMMSMAQAYFYKSFLGFYVLLMLFGTAWLLPRYLGKGRVEIALSKPIGRIPLAGMKFIAVFCIMSAILILGTMPIWLILSIRLDIFSMTYFGGLLYAMLDFLLLYGLIFSLGLISRSGAVSLIGYFVLLVASGLLAQRMMIYDFLGDSIWKTILDVTYHILPKYGEFGENYLTILTDWSIKQIYPVWSTILITVVIWGLAAFIFTRRDY